MPEPIERRRTSDREIEELVRTLRGYNGTPGVMERLTKIETRQDGVEDTLKEIKALLEKKEPPKDNPDVVSWTWIRDKIVQPALLLGVGWFFFQFLPNAIAQLNK